VVSLDYYFTGGFKMNKKISIFIIVLFTVMCIGLIITELVDFGNGLESFYVRIDDEVIKSMELDNGKLIQYNCNKDFCDRWVFDYVVDNNQLLVKDLDGGVTKFDIKDGILTSNIQTDKGYQNIIYKPSDRIKFNKMVEILQKN